jgi:GntR family transcriptional regulator, transcriptional repressor for pyruvate dehydrogenase complex
MSFVALKKNAIPKDIVHSLLDLIKEKKLKPGDRLPPERELTQRLEVSRPSLREALRALEIMHVVTIRQGSGTYITSLEPDKLVEHLDFVFSLDDSTFLDLFAARKVVEPGISARAAERATPNDVKVLETCLAKSVQGINDEALYFQADVELHDSITHIAGIPILTRFMASMSRLAQASRQRTSQLPGIKQQTIEDHRQIVEAIKAGDAERARETMYQHLSHIEQRLREATKL